MELIQRQKWIMDKLEQNGIINIAQISDELKVSRETIRKDIYSLGNKGLLDVIRGGLFYLLVQ